MTYATHYAKVKIVVPKKKKLKAKGHLKRPMLDYQPIHRRWARDYDYTESLSAEDKAWLAQFDDEYYGCDFRWVESTHPAQAQRRERFVARNAMERCVMSRAGAIGALQPTDESTDATYSAEQPEAPDQTPVPSYMNGAEYAGVLKEYRVLVDLGPKRSGKQEKQLALYQDFLLSISEADP